MTAVKICGLTRSEDAAWALEQGADYLGFVFYPRSPRCISVPQLARLAEQLPESARLVGVFVNEAVGFVQDAVERCRLSAVQLHGDEQPGEFAGLTVPVWRAVRLRDRVWQPDPANWAPERFVIDAFSADYGGTGQTVDWQEASHFCSCHAAILAGGLDEHNVGEAIRRVRPLGVDVSSGVEVEPGRKDHAKVQAFIRAARAATPGPC